MVRLVFFGTSAMFFGATTFSFAVGLTEADFDYLATQNVEKASIEHLNLSPKEQARLHGIINFAATSSAIRAKDVMEALQSFSEHQRWESVHPGELWDSPRR